MRRQRGLNAALVVVLCWMVAAALAGDEAATPRQDLAGRIAYSALTDGFWQIWVVEFPSGKRKQVTTTLVDKRTPSWANTGERILYRTTNGALEEIAISGGEAKAVVPTLGFLVDPRISASGKKLVFARYEGQDSDNADLFVYGLSDKKLAKVTDQPTLEYQPSWSPDESRIAYISGRGIRGHFLHVMNADGTKKKLLQPVASDDLSPAWSPDGHWIVFASVRTGDYEIWRVRSDGSQPEQMTHSPGLDSNPCYSPDGGFIALTSNRDGHLRVWVMRSDGSQAEPITAMSGSAREPAWWQPAKEGSSSSSGAASEDRTAGKGDADKP